jgi:hypothetical protein
MEQLNRIAIAAGAGILAGMLVLGTNHILVGDAARERFAIAMDRLVPEYVSLDAAVQLSTYDQDEQDDFSLKLLFAGATVHTDCGGFSVLDPCTISADLDKALRLTGGYTPVVQDDATLTVGEYTSNYGEILALADTVVARVDDTEQNVTNEGYAHTVSYLHTVERRVSSELWQRSLAAVPPLMLWLGAAGVGVIAAVLTAVGIRRTRTPQPVVVEGAEVFDELDPPTLPFRSLL